MTKHLLRMWCVKNGFSMGSLSNSAFSETFKRSMTRAVDPALCRRLRLRTLVSTCGLAIWRHAGCGESAGGEGWREGLAKIL